MSRTFALLGLFATLTAALIWVPAAPTQTYRPLNPRYRPYPYPTAAPKAVAPVPRVAPKLEPVAETKLLMEAMVHPNFRGLERLLRQKPTDAQAWTFARGQALLIGEAANLLMLRPPQNQGQPLWFERTTELRKAATDVARAAAAEDYTRSRTAFVELANSCNHCHQAFRVAVEIVPFQDPTPPPAGKTNLAP